jgi:hypothetical protein
MNLFSVKVTKYDDSSSHYRTDDKNSIRGNKYDISQRVVKKKTKNIKKKMSKLKEFSPKVKILDENSNDEYEYNSDSSIFTQENNFQLKYKEKIERNVISLTKNQFPKSERSKLIKNKFNRQMDQAKLKKFIKEDIMNQNLGKNYFNVECLKYLDSLEGSYKSLNSIDNKKSSSTNKNKNLINYYFIKNLNENKELILYNKDDSDDQKIKFDDNYKCYYSLDHKSKIIYIKPSPKLLSSISSILNSKLASSKATKNISMNQSKISYTPKEKTNDLAFDHNSIIQKLKNIEISRNEFEAEPNIVYSSEDEYDSNN